MTDKDGSNRQGDLPTEGHGAAVPDYRQCKYCGPGVQTGLPSNACENCMGTGLANPEQETAAWAWVQARYPNDAASDLAFDADEMVDAYIAGAAARHQAAVSPASQVGTERSEVNQNNQVIL